MLQFGMIHPHQLNAPTGQQTARCVFIIDPERRVQMMFVYPSYVGRNFFEILRCVDALQLTMYHKVATPANWKQGMFILICPFSCMSHLNRHHALVNL